MSTILRRHHGVPPLFLCLLCFILLTSPTEAFGAGYVSRGSPLKATKFRHGDIALAVPLFTIANRRLVKRIYFGNWLRDFSQIVDKGSLALVPYPILRALVAVFAFVQFGYCTREFEVTDARLGFYRPEEHVDNPKGYDAGIPAKTAAPSGLNEDGVKTAYHISDGLRPAIAPEELNVDPKSGMKNYIANFAEGGRIHPTSADYVEKQLIAAVACGRQGDEEAYIHLGAALHTLEDFVAHSNYVELAMQLIGREIAGRVEINPALKNVFAYTGGAVKVETARGPAPPLVTGTFGALDLLQSLLGEIGDKINAMSLPGLQRRTNSESGITSVAKSLIGLLGAFTPSFELDILKIQKAAVKSESMDWGELQSKPEELWNSIHPVLKLRDDIVKWVYDNMTVRAVQDALAAISSAIDKLVYLVLGIFLRPVLEEFSGALKKQEQELMLKDQQARLVTGEASVFDANSTADDPTHSQLCKDHYDDIFNEVAGRVAVRISSYAVTAIIQYWQPGTTSDPLPALKRVLETFHHPFNRSGTSEIQTLMYEEVREYVHESLREEPETFIQDLKSLSLEGITAQMNVPGAIPTAVPARPDNSHHPTTVLKLKEEETSFTARLEANIRRQLENSKNTNMDMDKLKEMFSSDPSGDNPNPLDSSLSKIPGISFLSSFEGIGVGEIAAQEGMGETLKDALISMILLDETRGSQEEKLAAGKFGWATKQAEAIQKARLREMLDLLQIRRMDTDQAERQFEEKRSAGEKLKEGLEKLKLKMGK